MTVCGTLSVLQSFKLQNQRGTEEVEIALLPGHAIECTYPDGVGLDFRRHSHRQLGRIRLLGTERFREHHQKKVQSEGKLHHRPKVHRTGNCTCGPVVRHQELADGLSRTPGGMLSDSDSSTRDVVATLPGAAWTLQNRRGNPFTRKNRGKENQQNSTACETENGRYVIAGQGFGQGGMKAWHSWLSW